MIQCPHCTEKMPDTFIICTACHNELMPQRGPSPQPPPQRPRHPDVPSLVRRGEGLGWLKWMQITLGTVFCLMVFLGPHFKGWDEQWSSSAPFPVVIGQEGHLFLTGSVTVTIVKNKDDLATVPGSSVDVNQHTRTPRSKSKRGSGSRFSNKETTVPAGSKVRVLDVSGALSHVIVLDGVSEGTVGWVNSSWISPISR